MFGYKVKPVKPETSDGEYEDKIKNYNKILPLYEFDQKPEHQIIFYNGNTLKTQEQSTF